MNKGLSDSIGTFATDSRDQVTLLLLNSVPKHCQHLTLMFCILENNYNQYLGKKTIMAVSQDVGTNLISSHLASKAVLQTSKNCGAIGGGERIIQAQAEVL